MIYHYVRMAENNYLGHSTKERVNAKKYFYSLRPILAAKWIFSEKTPPPIEFEQLMEKNLPTSLQTIVMNLLNQKRMTSEMEMIDCIHSVNHFIESELVKLKDFAKNQSYDENSWIPLNNFFLEIVNDVRLDSCCFGEEL